MKKDILLFYHSGSANHGCEAIVRSTYKILKKDLIVYSNNSTEDYLYGISDICDVKQESLFLNRISLSFFISFILYHIFKKKHAFDLLHFRPMTEGLKKAGLVLSIGGDAYCYGENEYILMINKEVKKHHVPMVLWGCSIEPEAMCGRVLEDLKLYNYIIARESITYQALKNLGFTNLSLFPDPAFQLNRIDLPLPDGFINGNTVGINVSPMIICYEKYKGLTLKNYICLIDYILTETRMNIALIPHVVWDRTDDRKPLSLLYNKYKDTGRICMIEDHNAEELKGYIARCRFMVAARTHASIAAYSTQVPTLVVGYSVKARGIARDIFGEEDNYVVPVQSLSQTDILKNRFIWIQQNEERIINHYKRSMPGYIKKAMSMNDIIAKYL